MAVIKGESAQAKGADGAKRAKRWLESTTRVNAHWVNPNLPAVEKLTFAWPHGGQTFSFDLGGTLKYGDYDGHMFFAESKNYDAPNDLRVHYSQFLVATTRPSSFASESHSCWGRTTPWRINPCESVMAVS